MNISLNRTGGPRPVELAPPAEAATAKGAVRRPVSLTVTTAPKGADAADAVDAAVEADLTRGDDIGGLFADYGYPPPPAPDFSEKMI